MNTPETETTINSYSKKLGFGWTTASEDGQMKPPTQPQITGTINQIRQAQKKHPQYRRDSRKQRCERWFYCGMEILSIQYGLWGKGSKDPEGVNILMRSLDKNGAFVTLKPQA